MWEEKSSEPVTRVCMCRTHGKAQWKSGKAALAAMRSLRRVCLTCGEQLLQVCVELLGSGRIQVQRHWLQLNLHKATHLNSAMQTPSGHMILTN